MSFVIVESRPGTWQTFFPNILDLSIPNQYNVLIISVTAGDDGNPDPSFYYSLEHGSIYSTSNDGEYITYSYEGVNIKNKTVCKSTVTGTNKWERQTQITHYFLRLPDGGPNGNGNEKTNNESLKKLKENGTPITSVDGAAKYNSWGELKGMVEEIIRTNKPNQIIHTLDILYNKDILHSDDIYTSLLCNFENTLYEYHSACGHPSKSNFFPFFKFIYETQIQDPTIMTKYFTRWIKVGKRYYKRTTTDPVKISPQTQPDTKSK